MQEAEVETTNKWVLASIVLLIAAVFGIGLLVPLGIAQGVLYVVPVALSLWAPGRRYTVQIAVACAFLTVVGIFFSHSGAGPLSYVLVNRAYSLVAIGMIVLIDRLHRQLGLRNEELVFRTRTLQALYEMGNALSSLHNVGTVNETAVRRACQLLAGDTAGLAFVDEDSGEIRWQFLSGASSDQLRRLRLVSGEGLVGMAIQSGKPVVVEDVEGGADGIAALQISVEESDLRAALVVPVGVGGKPIGALVVGYRVRHALHANDIQLLAGLADQVAIAINNTQLNERLRALSAMEERQRLAREMHDGLAQLLGNITAQATASAELLTQGRWNDAQHRLDRLREVAEIAYGEVRQSILGLRAASLGNQGFLQMLDEFAVRINQEEGLTIRVEVEPGVDIGELSPAVEAQAIRIVQEALANVRKHSRASEALITVGRCDGWFAISILDNGRGLDPPEMRAEGSHFGLHIMRERAESVGGSLTIETGASGGTLVTVRLPVSEEG